jgi:hypothetical protein
MRRAANGIVKSSYFADEAGIVIIAEDSSMDWLITGSDGIMITLEGSGGGYQLVPYDINGGICLLSFQKIEI